MHFLHDFHACSLWFKCHVHKGMSGSVVYLSRTRVRNPEENNLVKIENLCRISGLGEIIDKEDLTAVKLHFGESGNDTYIKPVFVRSVVDFIRKLEGKPFLTDTNTMYIGSRHNAADHLITAIRHGFAYAVVDCPLIIADGLKGNDYQEVSIDGGHFKSVRIARGITDADAMVVLTHVKGHALAGFGGAIKNLAMGCAPPVGKRDQHQGMQAEVNESLCEGCGYCETQCPFSAIHVEDKAVIDRSICYGCSACLQVCPRHAIYFNWERDVPRFLERMAEYSLGAAQGFKRKILYISFLTDITPDCDCVTWSDSPIVPDIGFLASADPVAIDTAALDIINQERGLTGSSLQCHHEPGEDKFTGVWGYVDGSYILEYAEKIGLGTRSYTLVEI